MTLAVLSLGSNKGDRFSYIRQMVSELSNLLSKLKKSDLMETEPVGVENQQWFLNLIICGNFEGEAMELLRSSQYIERKLGRDKKKLMQPRTADIDILLFGEEIIKTSELVIPHPQIFSRRFCLEGMYQTVADRLIPGTGKSVAQQYLSMSSQLRAQKIRFINEKGSDCSDGRA